MGSDLPERSRDVAPSFLVLAAKDPEGANLERAQIVKGWVGENDRAEERVYDVTVAEDPIAGLAEIATVWRDPDFDPARLAFYYLRVLEVPTPRWNAIDAAKYGKPIAGMRTRQQERAYTSPIWFTP